MSNALLRSRRASQAANDLGTRIDGRFLKHLLTVSPVVIYSLQPAGAFPAIYVSDTVGKLLGYRPDDFLNDPSFGRKQVHPDDVAGYDAAFARAVHEGRARLECRMRTHDRGYRWFRHEIETRRDDTGEPVEITGSMVDVTGEMEAVEQLRQNEQRFKDFADAASDWLWETDADLRFTWVSDRFKAFIGADPAIGSRREDVTSEDTTTERWLNHFATLETRQPFRNFEYIVVRNGHARHLRVSGVPVFGRDGTFQGYRGTGSDVTAIRRQEEALRQREQQLSRAQEIARLGDWRWIVSGDEVEWSDGLYAIMRTSREKHRPSLSDYTARIHRDDREASITTLKRIVAERSADAIEHRIRVCDGNERIFRVEGRCEVDETGAVVAVFGTCQDITELKQVETALRESEARLRLALDAARLGTWDFDLESGRNAWSARTREIYGASIEEEITYDIWLSALHPDDRERVLASTSDVVNGKSAGKYNEFRIRRPDGAWRSVAESVAILRNGWGVPVRMVGIAQDITERKRREDELRAAKEQAEAASRAKSAFLASMSHELRTPLNAVIGFGEVIASEMFGPVGHIKYAEYARDIHESGRHLLDLINDLLDTAKIESGKLRLQEEVVDLADLVEETVRLARASIPTGKDGIEIRSEVPAITLRVDRRAMKQVLINLLGNAVKFTPEGGSIRVQAGIGVNDLSLVVSDTGIGIPEERLAEIAQPFVQIENVLTRKHHGSGMGLFISKSLAEFHGGGMEIESAVGNGTRVTVRLPKERMVAVEGA